MIGAAVAWIIRSPAGRFMLAMLAVLVVVAGAYSAGWLEGAEGAQERHEQEDEERAQDVRDRIEDARGRAAADQRDPDERLRDAGRLRD